MTDCYVELDINEEEAVEEIIEKFYAALEKTFEKAWGEYNAGKQ